MAVLVRKAETAAQAARLRTFTSLPSHPRRHGGAPYVSPRPSTVVFEPDASDVEELRGRSISDSMASSPTRRSRRFSVGDKDDWEWRQKKGGGADKASLLRRSTTQDEDGTWSPVSAPHGEGLTVGIEAFLLPEEEQVRLYIQVVLAKDNHRLLNIVCIIRQTSTQHLSLTWPGGGYAA